MGEMVAIESYLELSNEITELKAENKALKERDWEECCGEIKAHLRAENDHLNKWITEKCQENRAVWKCFDELLEAVCQSEIVFRNTGNKDKAKMLVPIIKRAEGLKGKHG